MKLVAHLGVAAAAVVAAIAPAHAAAIVTPLVFVGGHANVEGPTTTDGFTTGTGFTDTFSFTTAFASTIAGSLTTHSLTDMSTGNVVEDLDFTSITLDGLKFANHNTSDANEEFSLPSSLLKAGDHLLTVNYNVDTATPATATTFGNQAAYSGDLYLTASTGGAGAVPEPASWAMFIGGFGLVGAGLRSQRRRTAVTFG